MSSEPTARRQHYGIAEVADALGLNRQLVTVWRRRRSRGMPEPDEELASGPLWTATTIEPWIDATRARLELEGTGGTEGLSPVLARQALRRFFRLVSLLLDDRLRPSYVARASRDLAELVPGLEQAIAGGDDAASGLASLLVVARQARDGAATLTEGNETMCSDLLRECLRILPALVVLGESCLSISGAAFEGGDVGRPGGTD